MCIMVFATGALCVGVGRRSKPAVLRVLREQLQTFVCGEQDGLHWVLVGQDSKELEDALAPTGVPIERHKPLTAQHTTVVYGTAALGADSDWAGATVQTLVYWMGVRQGWSRGLV